MRGRSIPEILGGKQVCELLVIKSSNLREVARSIGLPEPGPWRPGARAVQLPSGPVWLASDVRAAMEREEVAEAIERRRFERDRAA